MTVQPDTRQKTSRKKTAFLTVRIDPDMHEALLKLATRNDRTVAGELRVAVRKHLEAAA